MAQYNYKTGDLSIKTSIEDCMKFFDGLEVNRTQIQSRLMRTTGQGAVNAAKRGFGNTLKNRTGNLKRHIRYVMGSKARYVTVYSDADSGKATGGTRDTKRGWSREKRRIARYGFILAWEYTINATKPWGLRFQVGGRWVTKHSITVRPKDWIEPSVVKYADSYDLHSRLDKELQKQINYWEKRLTGGNLK